MSNPPVSPREQLLRLQQATFARIEEDVRAGHGREVRQLRTYRKRYDREVVSYQAVSSKNELIEKVLDASIVYCGDYHTLRQAQRTPIKILRAIVEKRKPIYLALELVPESAQKLANDYVRKRIDEQAFLGGIDYEKRWGFPWNHYKPLFEFARRHNLKIIALNADEGDRMPLDARDKLAARRIVEESLRSPDALIFALYGDLHVASPHIPRHVEQLLAKEGEKRKSLTVFQNSESIYWRLSELGLEHKVDVVKVSNRGFCVLSSPPWIKWQSYLSWLDGQSDLLDAPDEDDEIAGTPDYYHQLLGLAERIGEFLGLKPRALEHFSVYTADSTEAIDEVEKYFASPGGKRNPPAVSALIRSEIVESGSCYLPEPSVLYLSDLSENRAAEKAAQIIASKLAPKYSVFGTEPDIREIFYRSVLWGAIGFFGSKVVNPKRKCDRYRDFERVLLEMRKRKLRGRLKERKELAKCVLAHRVYELRSIRKGRKSGPPRKMFRLPPRLFIQCANALGRILAEQLYAMTAADRISIDTVRELFMPVPDQPKAGSKKYWKFAQIIRRENSDHESKDDRF